MPEFKKDVVVEVIRKYQPLSIESLDKTLFVTLEGNKAIKKYSEDTMEVKRMFVSPENRGKGIASQILNELTIWSKELGYTRCILETGVKQLSAIALYKKNSFEVISNYGEYENIDNSICFEKFL